jgi:[ribosomal protein S5]-alanine N-acetyltransferase
MHGASIPTINASRVFLRRITAEDLDAFYAIYSDPQVMRYWSTPPLADMDAARKLLSEILESYRQNALLKWGIARLTDGALVGTCTIFNLNLDHGRAEIGYALARAHWGSGYMHESLQALLGHAFGELNLRRLEADVDPRNAASIRTLERLGFHREGLLRERWHVNGEIQDAFFYGLLRHEWQVPNAIDGAR